MNDEWCAPNGPLRHDCFFSHERGKQLCISSAWRYPMGRDYGIDNETLIWDDECRLFRTKFYDRHFGGNEKRCLRFHDRLVRIVASRLGCPPVSTSIRGKLVCVNTVRELQAAVEERDKWREQDAEYYERQLRRIIAKVEKQRTMYASDVFNIANETIEGVNK